MMIGMELSKGLRIVRLRMLCICVITTPLFFFCADSLAYDDVKPEPSPVLAIASKVLDENVSDRERLKLIRSNPKYAADLLQSLVDDIEPGTEQELSRIPWLWEIAVLAADKNNNEVLARILEVSLPKKDLPVSDWQIAVIGGGLIFELSKNGADPKTRIHEIVARDDLLNRRWNAFLEISQQVVLDPKTSKGIRYDALRVFALSDWKKVRVFLEELFQSTMAIDPSKQELRLAALSAIVDVKNDEVSSFLVNHYSLFNSKERERACLVLLGNEKSVITLLSSIQSGVITSNRIPKRISEKLLSHENLNVRRLAKKLFVG